VEENSLSRDFGRLPNEAIAVSGKLKSLPCFFFFFFMLLLQAAEALQSKDDGISELWWRKHWNGTHRFVLQLALLQAALRAWRASSCLWASLSVFMHVWIRASWFSFSSDI
jgi:hypothetical protein